MKQFDLLGIGNSVVDVLYEVDETFIKNNKLEKDVMTIIDEEKAEKFYSQLKQGIEVAGGSVANSTVGFASLSGKPAVDVHRFQLRSEYPSPSKSLRQAVKEVFGAPPGKVKSLPSLQSPPPMTKLSPSQVNGS